MHPVLKSSRFEGFPGSVRRNCTQDHKEWLSNSGHLHTLHPGTFAFLLRINSPTHSSGASIVRRILLLTCLLLPVSGCGESTDPASAVAPAAAAATAALQVVNAKCPIMGGDINAPDLTAELVKEWNGQKVGFCCPPCLEEWDELSDEQKAERLKNPPKGH
jgi:hypothetical protein